MGEIADMMLDGTMCQVCGEFLDDPVGYPVTCCACDEGPGAPSHIPANAPKIPRAMLCPEHPNCERRFRTREAAAQHWLDKHG